MYFDDEPHAFFKRRLFVPQTWTSASRRPAPKAPPALTKSTAIAASAQQEGAAASARKVKQKHKHSKDSEHKVSSLRAKLTSSDWFSSVGGAVPGWRPCGGGRKQVER